MDVTLDISPVLLSPLDVSAVNMGVLDIPVDGTAPTEVLVDENGNVLVDESGNTLIF